MKESIFEQKGIYYRANTLLPDRQTFVFIHGLSGSSSVWYEYEEYFGKTYNVVTVDLRGHGSSIKYGKYEDYTIPLLAEDILDLIHYLNLDNLILVGFSFGAIIALECLRSFRGTIEAAVCISPTFSEENSRLFLKKAFRGFCRLNIIPVIDHGESHIDYSKYKGTRDTSARRFFADLWNTNLAPYIYCLSQLYSFHYRDLLDALSVRTLALHGRFDSISSAEYIEKILGSKEKIKLVIFEDADHTLILNSTTKVIADIDDFLA